MPKRGNRGEEHCNEAQLARCSQARSYYVMEEVNSDFKVQDARIERNPPLEIKKAGGKAQYDSRQK